MTMMQFWGRTILGLSFSRLIPVLFFFACAGQQTLGARNLELLAQSFRDHPSADSKRALLEFANSRQNDVSGALALLVVGSSEAVTGHAEDAIPRLRAAQQRLPELADYTSYYLARSLYDAGNYGAAIAELERSISNSPPSPLAARAVLLAAQVYLDSGDAAEGELLLGEYLPILPQPEGLLLLAKSQEAAGQLGAAAASYQRIYYEFPVDGPASQAESGLVRLRRRLGGRYPPVPAPLMFTRIDRLIGAEQHLTARKELQEMTTTLGGADRDRARVWLGKARHARHQDDVAYRWLKPLQVSHHEADAERLYYLLESARRLDKSGDVLRILGTLNEKYPTSEWRLKALISAGNMLLLTNSQNEYVPIFRACAESFPAHPRASYCHWKVAWSHYIRRQPEAPDLLRAHLRDFPSSEKASAALYFLGRLAERSGDLAAAGTYYRELEHEYPNYYYAYLSRQRLSAADAGINAESVEVKEFLAGIEFPTRRHRKNFDTDAVTTARIERARLLFSAGLRDWGETELRFGARNGGLGPVLAVELAGSASQRGDYGKSIREIKSLVSGYLTMPLDEAPEAFWRLAFPLPYRATIDRFARRSDLDLYFLAALIRQESEFDSRAVSRARAYGLTQVLPATGRELSRTLGIRGFRNDMLYEPEVNINMGTHYLRGLIDDLDGNTEAALAAYNAGKSRARAWLGWAEFQETAEFVETIPFTETRTYVQTVLRNAHIYRDLYADAD